MNIAVMIPCYNEEQTVKRVIKDFQRELSGATCYVYDNNSSDNTAIEARKAGAIVSHESNRGKGNVVRRMFREIDADIYIMVDGDNTYPAEFIHHLITPVKENTADIVVGDRLSNDSYIKANKRSFHTFGNYLVRVLINKLFKSDLKDIMSGYRVFNKKFVKTMPVTSNGFEIEVEMTLHALDKKFIIKELPIEYRDRPEGSFSKLNTFIDGTLILKSILWIFKDYKPLIFFSLISFIFFSFGLLVGIPVVVEFLKTDYITKVPSAVLSTGLMLISILSLFSGFILDTIVKHQKENFELYLNQLNL